MRRMLWTGLFSLIVGMIAINAEAKTLAEFGRVKDYEMRMSGFRLNSEQELTIGASCFAYRSQGEQLALTNAWILDAETRDVVWDLFDARSKWKNRHIMDESYTTRLPAGTYEVYYSTYPQRRSRSWSFNTHNWFSGWNKGGLDDVYEDLLDDENLDQIDDLYDKFSVNVEGSGELIDEDAVRAMHDQAGSRAIVSIRHVGNHAYKTSGFELKRDQKIRVYAVGEARDDGAYDYGMIMNADTREKVWQFDYDDSDHAGGAEKNRLVDKTFQAPAGRYVVTYVSDGSHSYERWNAAPPYDPDFWGVTVSSVDGNARDYSTFDYEAEEMANVIVAMTGVGDNESRRTGFSLARDMDLRIYAIGEGKDGEMYDYARIVDAHTRRPVWEMDYHDTDHAGGADKNRVEDKTRLFKKGDYVAYYYSDGSHSYRDWNADPPMDREHWGLTIMGAGKFSKSDVSEYVEEKDGKYLARLVEVGDDEYLSRKFDLDKDSEVNIFALGEGSDGRMYDYGWIEDGDGHVVWEMTYRRTEHAGGNKKNRLYSDTITLKAGHYTLYYETDGSHSYGRWNARQPNDPEFWGITLTLK